MILVAIVFLLIAAWINYAVYAYFYFSGDTFGQLKRKVAGYARDCNGLNDYLRESALVALKIRATDQGQVVLTDTSVWNYKRRNWDKIIDSRNVLNCSLSVCKGAKNDPFKYLCKYFNVKANQATLESFESMLNAWEAADQGQEYLVKKKRDAINQVVNQIPILIRLFSSERLANELGFAPVERAYHPTPVYTFQYVSPGGKSSMSADITLDNNMLERFVGYLGDRVSFRKSVAGQRALMTKELRHKIKVRDDFTCQECGNSLRKEPNLLLEIDHILPLSKGGITSEDNLQTLCWRCNRAKGAKIITKAPRPVKSSEQMYEEAKRLHDAGMEEEALKTLQEIIRIYPESEAASIAKKLL